MTQPKNPSDQKSEISQETKGFPNGTPFNAVQNEKEDTSTLKKNMESAAMQSTEANLNRDADLKNEANKSNLEFPNETHEKEGVSTALAVFERSRPSFLRLPKYDQDLEKYLAHAQLNKDIPMDSRMREYDTFRYEFTNLAENRDAFEIDEKELKKSVDVSGRLQTGLDLFYKSISIPTDPNKRSLCTVPLTQEEKMPYLLNYLNNNLSLEEAQLFEKRVLSDLDYSERIYLKGRIPNESTLLKNKKHLSLAPAFDPKYMYYNGTSHYEGMAWLMVMGVWFFALMSILQRKEK